MGDRLETRKGDLKLHLNPCEKSARVSSQCGQHAHLAQFLQYTEQPGGELGLA